MTEFSATLETLLEKASFALVHSIWICTLSAGVLSIALKFISSGSSAIRHNLAFAALLAMTMGWILAFVFAPTTRLHPIIGSSLFENREMPGKSGYVDVNHENRSGFALDGKINPVGIGGDRKPFAGQPGEFGTKQATTEPTLEATPFPPGRSMAWVSGPVLRRVIRFSTIAWLIGLVVFSFRHALGFVDLLLFRKHCHPVNDTHLLSRVALVKKKIGVVASVAVVESARISMPSVFGWIRPTLAVPISFTCGLPTSEIDAILAHEMAHIKRLDFLANLLQSVLVTIMFYHPAVWWVSRQIRNERENCCDDAAIAKVCKPIDIAAALTAMENRRRRIGLAFAGSNSNTSASRVKRLLSIATPARRTTIYGSLALAMFNLTICFIATTVCMYALCIPNALFATSTTQTKTQDSSSIPVPKKIGYLGNPAGWSSRYLKNHVERGGDRFVATLMGEFENQTEFLRQIDTATEIVNWANVLVVEDGLWSDPRTRPIEETIRKRVESGEMRLIFLGKGTAGMFLEDSPLSNLSPIQNHRSIQPTLFSQRGKVIVAGNSAELLLYSMTQTKLKKEATVLAEFKTNDEAFPLISRLNDGTSSTFFVSAGGLWRLNRTSSGTEMFRAIAKLLLPPVKDSELSETAALFVGGFAWDLRYLFREWEKMGIGVELFEEDTTETSMWEEQAQTRIESAQVLIIGEIDSSLLTPKLTKLIVERVASGKLDLGVFSLAAGRPIELPKEIVDLLPIEPQSLDRARDPMMRGILEFKTVEAEWESNRVFREIELKNSAKSISNLSIAGEKKPLIVMISQGHGTTLFVGSNELWRLEKNSNQLYSKIWDTLLGKISTGSTDEQILDRAPELEEQDKTLAVGVTAERYTISGAVIDAKGEPVANSVVIPVTSFGIPLLKSKDRAATFESFGDALHRDVFLMAVTDSQGKFRFSLLPGNYKFIAQTWLNNDDPPSNIVAANGQYIRLDGVIEYSFSTEMEAAEQATIKPLGTGKIEIETTTSSPYLVISNKPLAADPILGFAAWVGDFGEGVLCGNSMIEGRTSISGLPSGEIQLAAFANDNNPGFGGVLVEVKGGELQKVELPIIAAWSDGHKTPPQRLKSLVEFLNENPEDWAKLNAALSNAIKEIDIDNRNAAFAIIASQFDRDFELSDGTKRNLADCWAAAAYARLVKK